MKMSPPITYRCHQVSRVLLRQFAKDKKVNIFGKDGFRGSNIPENIGYIREDRDLYDATEAQWEKVENRFNRMIASVDAGTVLQEPDHIKTAKQLITLHFVRSIATQKLFDESEEKSFDELASDLKEQNLDVVDARRKWKADLGKTKLQVITDTMAKVQKYIDQFHLEIGVAAPNTGFILGDNPVINLQLEGPSGVIQGVGITASDVIYLPISQKYLLSLTKIRENSRYRQLAPEGVRLINKKTKSQTIKEFYAKPL